jgi:hypothetical protein
VSSISFQGIGRWDPFKLRIPFVSRILRVVVALRIDTSIRRVEAREAGQVSSVTGCLLDYSNGYYAHQMNGCRLRQTMKNVIGTGCNEG